MKKREILTKWNGMCPDAAVSDQVCLETMRTSAAGCKQVSVQIVQEQKENQRQRAKQSELGPHSWKISSGLSWPVSEDMLLGCLFLNCITNE